ncbi:MAG: endopeptidase La, partial [Candidatus Faecalibacterium intestinavium]|nr:endopeptidase La [Candidatus Faecalibacterium intestinavium]
MSEKVTVKVERHELHLPAIALRGLVVFPNNLVHFEVGREKSVSAVEWAMANNSNVFLVTQKEMDTDSPELPDLYSYGVVAEIKQVLRVSDELVKVLVEGKYRARLTALDGSGKFLLATLRPAPVQTPKGEQALQVDALVRSLKTGFDEYLSMNPRLAKDVVFAIMSSSDPAFLSEYIPANLLFRYEDKQAVMNENTLVGRLERLLEMLHRECQVMRIEKEIADKVNESMDKSQRDYYLHEQLHIISDELGEGDDTHDEAENYRRRIEELHLEADSETKLLKEVDRLSRMQGSNQEATVIRTYLDTCLDLPWNTFTTDNLEIPRAQQILDRDHYGLKKVKDRILELLAVRKLAPDVKAQIICLVGPPGVGKTSIARSIAECLGRKYVRLSLGGVRDEAEIRGHRRTYIGAMPGKIISAMISAKSQNPLMLLDEIDKLAGDFRGDPAAALLEALDPEQNNTFKDHFLDIPYDLSHVLFITTANDLGGIPGPLRDRMDIIELPSYTRVEKYNIARKHLLPKQLKACGLTGKVTLNQSALYGLIDGYTREAGVRSLERTITSVLRKCARKIAAGEAESIPVTGGMLEELLGPKRVKPEFLNRTGMVGIANGLAWTSVGGETLPIEVQMVEDGSGKITVTGSLGDVMKESAQLAVTYARVHAAEYGIDTEKLKKCDLHIHAPEGAVPKDGPSAGVTLTTALISCLSGKPVRGDVAMTGEITLHGNVLAIGGLREKSMAAYREGMKLVLIPKDNESDLYEVDDEVKANLEFLPVSDLSQVLRTALSTGKTAPGRRSRAR